MSKKLYVGNLIYSLRDADLMEIFEPFGQVNSAVVMSDHDTGRSKGFGFVEMSTAEEAQQAIQGLNEKSMQGRQLMVNIAKPREERPRSSAGGYGDRGGYNDRGGYGDRGGYR